MRLLLKSTVVLSVVFALMIVLIQSRPYDGRDLQAFFSTVNCNHPCWQHIRPGETTVDEAVAILKADTWVSEVEQLTHEIWWSWSGRQPALVDDNKRGTLLIDGQQVVSVRVPLNAGFGDLLLSLGQPDWTSAGKFRHAVRVQFTYPDANLTLLMHLECPMSPALFLRTQPEIRLNRQAHFGMQYESHLQFLKRC